MSARVCFAVLEHRADEYLRDVVANLRAFCPTADVVLYWSGRPERCPDDVPVVPASRPLAYGKLAPFFLDTFEWAADRDYDYVVNVESDMFLVRPGFPEFLDEAMRGYDYLGCQFHRGISRTSQWKPYRSLWRKPELPHLLSVLGLEHLNQCFNPGQVFGIEYVRRLLASPSYSDIRRFVERNQGGGRSYALEEILLPTLVDHLGLRARAYPATANKANRFRPYLSLAELTQAAADPDVYFVHPVRREEDDPARQAARRLVVERDLRSAASARITAMPRSRA